MNDNEPQDSFELFADTLTITLGCIIFIALLLVTITRSHQMDKSGLFHFERRSELLNRQIEIAISEVPASKRDLELSIRANNSADALLQDYEYRTAQTLNEFLGQNDKQYANAILSENIRSQLFLTKLPWMLETINQNIGGLENRIDRAFAEASETAIAISVLREQNIEAPVPTYIIVNENKIYPVLGGPGRTYKHIQWDPIGEKNASSNGKVWQLSTRQDAGMSLTDGIQYLRETTADMTRDSKSQIVLLVYADSFNAARLALKELSTWKVNFTWRPFGEGQRILMTEGGLPPESPL